MNITKSDVGSIVYLHDGRIGQIVDFDLSYGSYPVEVVIDCEAWNYTVTGKFSLEYESPVDIVGVQQGLWVTDPEGGLTDV